jgi:hypothetical protein
MPVIALPAFMPMLLTGHLLKAIAPHHQLLTD